jgi:hypothetical protein
MCLLQIHARSQSRVFEVLPEEPGNAELAVEDAVSQVLLDIFDGGAVDEVKVHFALAPYADLRHCSIHIHVQCSCQHFAALPLKREYMRHRVQTSMYSLLKELFGSVEVDCVTLCPTACDYENDPVLCPLAESY